MPESLLPPDSPPPLDAIVMQGARSKPPIRTAPVPWEQITPATPPAYPFEVRPQDIYRPTPLFHFESPGLAQYVVPRTFGMSAILGIITALAVLFGGFQLYDAHPVLYLFFGVQAVVVCLAQMLYGKAPRAASAISGGLLLPIFVIAWISLSHRRHFEGALCLLLGSVPIGAFFGYITGTMAAGVFLLMDAAERLLPGNNSNPSA